MKFFSLMLLALFSSSVIFSQDESSVSVNLSDVPLELFDADREQMEKALKLRDPFKRKSTSRRRTGRNIPDGPRTEFTQNVMSIDGVPLSRIRIVGVLLGEERRALAKISADSGASDQQGNFTENLSSETYVLREGMKIGENDAELKAILPGGIVLVEKITNVYDQDEYLETIIPIVE